MEKNHEAEVKNMFDNLPLEAKGKLAKLVELFQDEDFRAKLKETPRKTLESNGFDLPADKPVIVLENDEVVPNDDKAYYIQLPVICDEMEELSESSYEDVAGGGGKEFGQKIWAVLKPALTKAFGAFIKAITGKK